MNAHRTLALLTILAAVACANTPRSRDTGNPDVAGATLAVQVCSNYHGVTGSSRSPNFWAVMWTTAGEMTLATISKVRSIAWIRSYDCASSR